MRNIIVVALAATLTLAACGGGTDQSATETSPSERGVEVVVSEPTPTDPPTTTVAPEPEPTVDPTKCERPNGTFASNGATMGTGDERQRCVEGTWEPFPAATTTTEAPYEWQPEDFIIDLFVVESKCFGTAGANVVVEPDLTLLAMRSWSGEATLVYEVNGGEHVETYSLELSDDGTYSYRQALISTESCDYTLTATVVSVRTR